MPPLIELRVEEPIAYVTICRPRYRNAVTRAMTKDIEDAFYQAQDDPRVKIIVLQGQGEHFSSGHDLGTPEGKPCVESMDVDELRIDSGEGGRDCVWEGSGCGEFE